MIAFGGNMSMITDAQWLSLKRLRRAHFRYPDMMQWPLVQALDTFADSINKTPSILSDYRTPESNAAADGSGSSQHMQGLAADHYWEGVEPVWLWDRLIQSRLFSGIGIYRNDKGAVSFHTDVRSTRSPENPATWGQLIHGSSRDPCVAASSVLDLLKTPTSIALLVLVAVIGYAIWKSSQS